MANTSKITGLRPINQPFGAIKCNYYEAATGTAFYLYQPVDLDSNGRVIVATASNATLLLGSVLGVYDSSFGPVGKGDYSGYVPANPNLTYTTSDGLLKVLVADDPSQFFVIEEDTGGSALTAQEIGTACSYTYIATTGNTLSGICNAVLDRSTTATDTTNTLRLIKKWDKPDNAFGDYCKWVVQINRHRLNGQPLSGGTLV